MKTIKKITLISTLALCVFSCNNTSNQPGDKIIEAAQNTLTDSEKNDGWQLLFDGKTSTGWRGFKKEAFPEYGWEISDGTLMVDYSGKGEEGHGGDIITEKQYDNYHFKIDWKISPGGNSGVLYFVTEDDNYDVIWHTAPEMQVIDGFGYETHHDFIISLRQISGALYDLYPPKKGMSKDVGEWNTAELIVRGNDVEHWLNGELVVKYDRTSADLAEKISKSKFAEYKAFLKAPKGHIGLQDHGEKVWYRNIKIKEL